MQLFNTIGADSAYDKWLDPISGHKDECNCDRCHDWHKEEGLVEDHAKNFPKDYQCCVHEWESLMIDAVEESGILAE